MISDSDRLKSLIDAIKTLENCEERKTDSFRIVINSLREKVASLQNK